MAVESVHPVVGQVPWRDGKRYAWIIGAVVPLIPFLAWGLVEWTGSSLFWYFGPVFVFVLIPMPHSAGERPGVHHFGFSVASRTDVDAIAAIESARGPRRRVRFCRILSVLP